MTDNPKNDLRPNVKKAWDFLSFLNPNGPHRVEFICSQGGGHLGAHTFSSNQYEEFAQTVEGKNSAVTKANAYILASAPHLIGDKRLKENIPETDILQVDIDCKDFPGTEVEQKERALGLLRQNRPKGVPAPTLLCFTGGGYQAFWKLREPIEAHVAEELQQSLIVILNGDTGTHDVSHLMRLPGTVNWLSDNKRKAGRQPELAVLFEPAKPPVLYEVADFKIKRQKSNGKGAEKAGALNMDAVGDPEPLPDDLSEILPNDPKWFDVMITGDDPPDMAYGSRSELVHAFNIRMLSHGMKPGHLLSIITNPAYGISAHVLENSSPPKYAKRQVASAQAYLARQQRPKIAILPGQLPFAVTQAEQALIEAGAPIFQCYDSLVRVVRLPHGNSEDGVQRDNGALILKAVIAAWLRERFAIVAIWIKPNKDGDMVAANPPADAANVYLARSGEWEVPFLQAVTQIPTLRADGSILQEPGYDSQSAMLYDPGAVEFPLVPEAPSKEEAQAALDVLSQPFRKFCFARPVDRSVALAAILTALVRRMFSSAPLFIIEAPVAGTGKSLFCETLGIIAMGHKPSMMSQGKTLEEQEKRLSSVLMAGDPVIVIDNCEKPIEGDFLCSMLTQEWVQSRILGKSEVVRLPTRSLVVATGNNPEVAGDMARRTLKCRLDAQVERPDQLQYEFDPRDEAYADRAQLVVAGLTVIRAYIAAGRPNPLPKIGSFEQWNVIREALVWLGAPDPAEMREQLFEDDPRKGELIDLLRLWWKVFGREKLTLSDLSTRHEKGDAGAASVVTELIAKTRYPVFNTRSIGKYLASRIDQIAGGLMLRSEKDPSGVKCYWVLKVDQETKTETEKSDLPF